MTPIPKYRQIAENLRAAIDAGLYPPGKQLPSLRELADQYGTSTRPPRTAIYTLRAEGLVQVITSSGARVTAPKETPAV